LTAAVVALLSAVALVGCAPPGRGTPSPAPPRPAPVETPVESPVDAPAGVPHEPGATRTVATDLRLPWSLVRLATGTTLVSERDTALVKEVDDAGGVRVVGEVAGVQPGGEGGLLGLAVSPDKPEVLYAYTTTATDNRVVRIALSGTPGRYSLGAAEPVLTGIPKAGNHNGGRIKFGPDGMLYVTAGDAGNPDRAQDRDSLGGKILRIEPDGAIPADNPFPGSPVYSWGHRNPQGITWDGAGRLWASEFGQNTWDELNLITPGSNYGWPIVEGTGKDERFVNPVQQWAPSEASPSGLLFSHETLFLAALRGQRLWSIRTAPGAVTATPWFVGEFGRLRDVIDGPGGSLWMITSNTGQSPRPGDDRIIEVDLVPVGVD